MGRFGRAVAGACRRGRKIQGGKRPWNTLNKMFRVDHRTSSCCTDEVGLQMPTAVSRLALAAVSATGKGCQPLSRACNNSDKATLHVV
jgi:hypothetical protein